MSGGVLWGFGQLYTQNGNSGCAQPGYRLRAHYKAVTSVIFRRKVQRRQPALRGGKVAIATSNLM
jgi:hypothetical protein